MTINELAAKIKMTNNGYIFAPTGEELDAAQSNPELFKITLLSSFPYSRITLK